MKIHIPAFTGIAPALNPRDLPDAGAQEAVNIQEYGGVLAPMRGPSTTAETTLAFHPRTLYRYGETIDGGTPVWWAWESPDIDVVRTQIAGDAQEWTFWTGETPADDPLVTGDRLRGTYSGFAAGTDTHGPVKSFAMALPAPAVPIAAGSEVPDVTRAATITINDATTWYDDLYHWDGQVVKKPMCFTLSANGARSGHIFGGIRNTSGTTPDHEWADGLAALVALLNSNYDVDANYDATSDVLTLWTTARGSEATLRLEWGQILGTAFLDFTEGGVASPSDFPLVDGQPSEEHFYTYFRGEGSLLGIGEDGDPGLIETRVYTYTRFYRAETGYEIESAPAPIGEQSTVEVYPVHNSLNPVPETEDQSYDNRSAMRPVWLGEFYPHDAVSGEATDDFWNAAVALGTGTFGVRIYRATSGQYLLVDELEYTSGGTLSPATDDDGNVVVQQAVSAGGSPYYRPGNFEGSGATYSPAMSIYNYVDRKSAAALGLTMLPSLTWNPPPEGMRGLVNLPNGVMAGFVGRDVYFCEPYRPHAWPLQYVQTLDYPIVALATLDTTLVALTTGTPYFLQGSHPEVTTVVQGQLKQSCASRRAVVSMNGVVLYASPDGLIQISPGGSQNITAGIIKPQQWRASYSPGTISAWDYEGQYVAFWDTAVGGNAGFVFDPGAQRFVHHTYAGVAAGYHDRRDGALYVAEKDGGTSAVVAWDVNATTPHPAQWRSKVFVLPFITSFGWAQVAASEYPAEMFFKLYVDGVLSYTYSPTSRQPFRLPVRPGREVYVDLSGVVATIYSVTLAQSGHELLDT